MAAARNTLARSRALCRSVPAAAGDRARAVRAEHALKRGAGGGEGADQLGRESQREKKETLFANLAISSCLNLLLSSTIHLLFSLSLPPPSLSFALPAPTAHMEPSSSTPLRTPTMADFDLAEWFVNIPENANTAEADLDFDAWRAALKGDTTTTTTTTTVNSGNTAAAAAAVQGYANAPMTPSTQAALDALVAPATSATTTTTAIAPPQLPQAQQVPAHALTAVSLATLQQQQHTQSQAQSPVPMPAPAPSGSARRSARAAKRGSGQQQQQQQQSESGTAAAKRSKRAASAARRPAASEHDFDGDDMASEFGGSTTTKDKKSMNKAAADRYRRKKRAQFQNLQEENATLTTENSRLRSRCDRLEVEAATLKEVLWGAVRQSASAVAIARALGIEPAAADLAAEKASN